MNTIGNFIIGVTPIGGYSTLEKILPSYLYTEYADDDALHALVAAYNQYAQSYLDFLNNLQLPIYTGDAISGVLLDWVIAGLYGIESRPVLPYGRQQAYGPANTFVANFLPANTYRRIGPSVFYATTDDVFKRIVTWCFYKGDGFQFNVRWLKRRIMRFLIGVNGIDPGIDETYQISVIFSGLSCTIRILNGVRTVLGGALPNRALANQFAPNQLKTSFMQLAPLAMAPTLKAAIDAGVLPLPFQYTYTVIV